MKRKPPLSIPPKGEVNTHDTGVVPVPHGFDVTVQVRALERDGMDEGEAFEWIFWHVAARLREMGSDPKDVLDDMPNEEEWEWQ